LSAGVYSLLETDDANLYAVEDTGQIDHFPLAGGSPTPWQAPNGMGPYRVMALDSTSLYWTTGATGAGYVMKLTPK
jgi:hypothetical protein